MKRVLGLVTIVALAFLPALCVAALSERLEHGELIVDEAGLLDAHTRELVVEVQRNTLAAEGVSIAVVTLSSVDEAEARRGIERLARRELTAWRVDGSKAELRILLLIAKQDRNARIQLGAGWGQGWNEHVRGIMEAEILPAFRDGSSSQGVLEGVVALADMASRDPAYPPPAWSLPVTPDPSTEQAANPMRTVQLAVGFACVSAFVFFVIRITPRKRSVGGGAASSNSTSTWPMGGGVGGFGGGIGGGGGHGGGSGGSGGSSGGSGATGSW